MTEKYQTGRFPVQEFNEVKRLNPFWSDFICFAEVIKSRNFLSIRTIKKYFVQLVDKNDFAKSEKGQIIKNLIRLSREANK